MPLTQRAESITDEYMNVRLDPDEVDVLSYSQRSPRKHRRWLYPIAPGEASAPPQV